MWRSPVSVRHEQFRTDWLKMWQQRADLPPDTYEYESLTTAMDQILASVFLLGTIPAQPAPG